MPVLERLFGFTNDKKRRARLFGFTNDKKRRA